MVAQRPDCSLKLALRQTYAYADGAEKDNKDRKLTEAEESHLLAYKNLVFEQLKSPGGDGASADMEVKTELVKGLFANPGHAPADAPAVATETRSKAPAKAPAVAAETRSPEPAPEEPASPAPPVEDKKKVKKKKRLKATI